MVKNKIIAVIAVISLNATSIALAEEVPQNQNRQLDKIAFTKQDVEINTLSPYLLQEQLSPYQIFAGTVIPGVLISGINSDLPGQVIGQVSQNVYDSSTGKYLLIPQGTKIVGQYDSKTTYAQERSLIIWNRLIFPSGKSVLLGNMLGTDQAGYSGFKDKVNSHYGRVVWSAILGGVLSAGATTATGTGTDDNSYRAQAGAGVAQNIANAASNIVNKNLEIQPTIIIRPGYMFNIMLSKDIVLEPYHE